MSNIAVRGNQSVGMTTTGSGSKIAPQDLQQVMHFAEVMSTAGIALPKHLREEKGACMAVVIQALEWQMSPFAVAAKSYAVNGVIAYEAQLIAAVVNTRSGIEGRLKYRYEGEGQNLKCFVSGKVDGEILDYESPMLKDIKPQNSPLWKTDPKQQIGYYSARSWARRHTPEVLLGVYDREEAEQFKGADNAKDVTPRPTALERLQQARETPQEPAESDRGEKVDNETGEIIDGDPEASDGDFHGSEREGEDITDVTSSEDDTFPGDTDVNLDTFDTLAEWGTVAVDLAERGDEKKFEAAWKEYKAKLSGSRLVIAVEIWENSKYVFNGKRTVLQFAGYVEDRLK